MELSVPCAGGVTMVNVSESPSMSLAVMVMVTALSSFVVAEMLSATGGLLQTGSAASVFGSDGVAGLQAPVVVAGKVPTGEPFVGNELPEVLMVPHAVRLIEPRCSVGTSEPVGVTSPTPLVQITFPL